MLLWSDYEQLNRGKVRRASDWDLHRVCFTEGRMQKQHNFHAPPYIASPLEKKQREHVYQRHGQQRAFSSTSYLFPLLQA